MLACFVCFTLRALLLADLVQAQAEGEDTGHFAKGWRRCGALLVASHLLSFLLRPSAYTATSVCLLRTALSREMFCFVCMLFEEVLSFRLVITKRFDLAFGPARVCFSLAYASADVRRFCSPSFARRWEHNMKVEWALHVIPCVAMLYLMRKAGEPTAASSSNGGRGFDERSSDERTGFVGGGADEAERGSGTLTKSRKVEGADIARNYGNYGSGGSLR